MKLVSSLIVPALLGYSATAGAALSPGQFQGNALPRKFINKYVVPPRDELARSGVTLQQMEVCVDGLQGLGDVLAGVQEACGAVISDGLPELEEITAEEVADICGGAAQAECVDALNGIVADAQETFLGCLAATDDDADAAEDDGEGGNGLGGILQALLGGILDNEDGEGGGIGALLGALLGGDGELDLAGLLQGLLGGLGGDGEGGGIDLGALLGGLLGGGDDGDALLSVRPETQLMQDDEEEETESETPTSESEESEESAEEGAMEAAAEAIEGILNNAMMLQVICMEGAVSDAAADTPCLEAMRAFAQENEAAYATCHDEIESGATECSAECEELAAAYEEAAGCCVTGVVYAENAAERIGLERAAVGDLTACGTALSSCSALDAQFASASSVQLPPVGSAASIAATWCSVAGVFVAAMMTDTL